MTDEELIARLRKDDTDFWHCEAADRIEELLAERKKAVDAFVDLARATLAEIKAP
jgi:hypothetical protein